MLRLEGEFKGVAAQFLSLKGVAIISENYTPFFHYFRDPIAMIYTLPDSFAPKLSALMPQEHIPLQCHTMIKFYQRTKCESIQIDNQSLQYKASSTSSTNKLILIEALPWFVIVCI